MRHTLEPGYVLLARPYSDTSLLCEIFTRHQGRCGVIAKGARGPRSKLRALLQPAQPLLLSWKESGDLGTLTGAESAAPPLMLEGERIFYVWYLNELLLKLVQRHDPHDALFDRYIEALGRLPTESAETGLRFFEKHLLAETGYGLHLEDDLRPEGEYRYDPEQGPILIGAGLLGRSLMALRDETPLDARGLLDARKLLRPLLARQLAGRELETPKLLRAMRSREKGTAEND